MKHIPVLIQEIQENFHPQAQDILIDATLGQGGHAKAFLEASRPTGKVIGLDDDPEALKQASIELAEYHDRVIYINENFSNLESVLNQVKDSTGGGIVSPSQYTHILFDLGVGSHQLSDITRGFSFKSDGSLTMRYGVNSKLPDSQFSSLNWITKRLGFYPDVLDIIQLLNESSLAEIIKVYGEERFSNKIAKTLKRSSPPKSAAHFAKIIASALPANYERNRLHPATRTFQAFRLAVNRELEALQIALPQAVKVIRVGGLIAVISFHSLEDRITKHFFKESNQLSILTKKPIMAKLLERKINPRSRSAKLRMAKKINPG